MHLDKNKNGILDNDEIKNWMLPDDFEKYKLEASILMDQVDLNRDNELQLEELLNDEIIDKFYNLLSPKFYANLEHKADQSRASMKPHDEF